MELEFLSLYETDLVKGRDYKNHTYTVDGVPLANELYVTRDGSDRFLVCWSDILNLIEFSIGFRLFEPAKNEP